MIEQARASNADTQKKISNLTGKQKAAILMLAIGRERSSRILKSLQEDEVRELSIAMSSLGPVSVEAAESVCNDFTQGMELSDGLVGSYKTTEEYLKRALPASLVEKIMDDIRGPAGRSVWAKMTNMPETALANYLRNEQPQTVAVVLSYIAPAHVARVLSLFPEDFTIDVIVRMLHMTPVSKDVLASLEVTLQRELITAFGRSSKRNSYAFVAEVYNNFDRKTETTLTDLLGERSLEDMEKVNKLKFTFDDVKRLSSDDMMRVMSAVNKDGEMRQRLPLALKGANPNTKKLFLACMSRRAGAILLDEISSLGAVRMKDVESAQSAIIALIKDMSNEGEVDLAPVSDELIE
ncbi:flagellar motor switch protein FliG (plasmid) [Aristophania vespae]|uniref:Flagellar motor switch protein FliG n=1 Tax=Aristophania vespae TaxID=2697033 RepID=A0A6P1NLG5_9PROT|nr:flagellar motor switch protein FliG [Aristophania vespae]QHI96472.1 flagellar motor switch protein FliG [Aristophania vespae]UMM64789.1 Flagellar motor switch protein FliG [Aristophania vespae]